MKQRKSFKRAAAMLLAVIMVFCSVNLNTFAATGDLVDEPIDMGLSYAGGNAGALLFNSTAISTPSNTDPEIIFTRIEGNSYFTYNDVDVMSNFRMNMFGLYLAPLEMVGKDSAETGDVIAFGGVWQRQSDSKYYDFGQVKYVWDGSSWCEVIELTLTKYIGHESALTFTTNKIDLAPDGTDYAFTKIADKGTFTFNGEDKNNLRMTQFGLYTDTNEMVGRSAQADDTLEISGMWKYAGDNKVYDIKKVVWKYDGSDWVDITPIEPTSLTLTPYLIGMNHVITFNIKEIPNSSVSGEPYFQKADETSVFTYNGVDCVRMPRMTNSFGLYMEVADMTGVTGQKAAVGDTIILGGVWEYEADGQYYNFGTQEYMWNGVNWAKKVTVETEPLQLTPYLFSMNHVLTFHIDKITEESVSGEPNFIALNETSVCTYNGVASQRTPRMTNSFGLYLAVSEMTGGERSNAESGDVIELKGEWQYSGDGKYYDFGTVSYRFNGSEWVDVNAEEPEPQPETYETGIEDVMIYDASGKLIIKPTVSDYSNAADGTRIEDDALTKLKEYNFFDKIKVSTDAETKTLREVLGGADEYYYNLWSENTIVIDMDDAWNGKSVTKITIEEGCEFPAYAYTNSTSTAKHIYVTTENMTYTFKSIVDGTYNATYERYYPIVKHTTAATKIHVRVGKLLVFLSNHDYQEVESGTSIVASKLDIYNVLDNIFVNNGTETKALKDIVTTEFSYNQWGEKGCVLFGLQDGWDGTNITSVLIQKGTEFPAYAYTSGATTDRVKYVTASEIVFKTTAEDMSTENITWTSSEPHTEETVVTGVKSGHNDQIVSIYLTEDDYGEVATIDMGENYVKYNFLEKIRIYAADGTYKTLKEAHIGQKYYNMFDLNNVSLQLDVATYDNAAKIVIPAGTIFPSYKYTGGTPWGAATVNGTQAEMAGYEVVHEKVFEKGTGSGTINWTDISTGDSNVPADVNGDGKVSSADLVAMKKYLVNGYRANETADCNDDYKIDEEDLSLLRQVLLGKVLHNYKKESASVPIFSSSDAKMDAFLNDYFKRHVGYVDYVDGDMTVNSYKVGELYDGIFNTAWNTMSATWFDSSAGGMSFDRTEAMKNIIDKVIVDRYGYVWDGTDAVEDTNADLANLSYHSMGWSFPNATQGNSDSGSKDRYWDFNTGFTNGSLNQENGCTWSSNISASATDGVYKGTASGSSSVTFTVKEHATIDNLRDPIINTKYAPWLAVDLRMSGVTNPENIDDVYISYKTGRNTAAVTVRASDIAAMNYEFTSDYAHVLWIPMYTQSAWDNKDIYEITIEIRAKDGTTFGGEIGLNYVRPWFDTRHSNNNAEYLASLKQYYSMTGDKAFVEKHIEDARKAMTFYMQMYDTEKHLNKQSYLYGHGGSKTELWNSLGNGYWDILYTPVYDFQSNLYFYQALNDMMYLEKIVSAGNATVDTAATGAYAIGSASYSSYNLETTANALLTEMRNYFWDSVDGRFIAGFDNEDNAVDFGYAMWNLEAIEAGVASTEQAQSIIAWLNNSATNAYQFGFAPRTNTVEGNKADYFQYVVSSQLETLYNLPFGQNVQYGGAVMFTSYYDLMSRLQVSGANDAYDRLTKIGNWYRDVEATFEESGNENRKFYKKYYDNLGLTMQDGGLGTGNGAVGIDGEFTESLLVAATIPYGFFGIGSDDGKCLNITPNLPDKLDFWKIENMAFNGVKYDVSIYEDAVRLNSVSGDTAGLTVKVTLDCPAGKAIYVDGVEQDVTAVDGKATVTVSLKETIIEVK